MKRERFQVDLFQARTLMKSLCLTALLSVACVRPNASLANPNNLNYLGDFNNHSTIQHQDERTRAMNQGARAGKGNPTLATEVNEKAQRFVNNANDFLKQRARIESDLDQSIRMLTAACPPKSDASATSESLALEPRIKIDTMPWESRLELYLTTLGNLQIQIAAETKDSCGTLLRAPGLRGERCIILEMGDQWTKQTERFVKLQQNAKRSDELLLIHVNQTGGSTCQSSAENREIAQRISKIHSLLNTKAKALIDDSIQELVVLTKERR